MEPRIAVFDMDGTLVDSDEVAFGAAEDGLTAYYARRGLPAVVPSRLEMRRLVGLPSIEYFVRLLPADRRADAAEVREMVARREAELLAAGEGRLFPGVREALARLRADGWKLALVSNCGHIYFDANLEHLRLREMTDVALCVEDFPTKAENVRQALGRLGGSRGVMVGDRAADIEAGRANGLRTVGCTYGFGALEELASADRRVGSPSEIVQTLEELWVRTTQI